jgi:hypothetical protein
MVKHGLPYGGSDGGRSFNDAKSLGLSPTSYCIGAKLFWQPDYLFAIQFIYQQNGSVASEIYGGDGGLYIHDSSLLNETFMIHNEDRIDKVSLYVGRHTWLYRNTFVQYVVGIQFYTTAGQTSRLYGSYKGELHTESYEGYTLGYAQGRSGLLVDTLQFVWYKQGKQTK